MEHSKAALVPKYACGHPKKEGHEYCPKCCYLCGHSNKGQVAFAANSLLLGPQGPGIQIAQCMAIDTQTLQRCNMIISIDLIRPNIVAPSPKKVVLQ